MYKKKLLKMMAFNPENNIDQFISECVLDANPIESLNQLREQKELFEKVRNMYENLLESKVLLEEIERFSSDYEKKQHNFMVKDMLLDLQRVKLCEEELKKMNLRIIQYKQELKELTSKIDAVENERKLADERYNAATNNTDFQNFTKSIDNLNRQLEELDREICSQEKDVEKLRQLQSLIDTDLEWLIADEDELKSEIGTFCNYLSENVAGSQKSELFIKLVDAQKIHSINIQKLNIKMKLREKI
ncbi:hypothetical protein CIY_22790 [Butyrivibrio fibrisolvens 16/4]|nr:hypothetical protein CIY_22790 [Butyrivibrio fibrisolvens 16/4]